MSVMDIGHVSMLMLGAGMFVFMGVHLLGRVMFMELIMRMPVLMDNRHMDMEMGMFFICQQQRTCHHQNGSDAK